MIRRSPALTWYAIIVAITIVLALVLPVNPITLHRYHITVLEYREAILTIIIPYIVIWFAAFFAYDKANRYAQAIKKSTDGPAFTLIANGLGVLAWGLAVSTVVSVVIGGFAGKHPILQIAHTIVANYLNLLFPLIGFTLIGNGAHRLLLLAKARLSLSTTRVWFSLLALVGVFYTFFALHNHFTKDNPYHLPIFLLLTTLVAPYLYTWYTGILAAYELRKYATRIKGILYQRALNMLGIGITVVIAASITIQYVTGALGGTGGNLTLGYTLLITYVLLFMEAAGYVLIAIGARQLKRIEEV